MRRGGGGEEWDRGIEKAATNIGGKKITEFSKGQEGEF